MPTQCNILFISSVRLWVPRRKNILKFRSYYMQYYFDDHKVIVVTGFPIGDILHNKEAIGRIAKWACELGSNDIEFRPRTAIKTQALVDFVSEWTEQQVPDNPETAEV
jgi:hypothetical protein